MAGSVEQSSHFADRRSKGLPIVDAPKFDVESYAVNYDSHTRIARLHHIALLCPSLATEALHLAIPAAKTGRDTALYLGLTNLLHNIDTTDEMAISDAEWMDRVAKANEQEAERLEHELRGYKNNLIKESIRMGQEDLGTHHLSTSNLDAAAKAYQKMREYCTTPKHIAEMTAKLIYIDVLGPQWLHASSSCQKLRALSLKPEDKARFDPVAQACTGLANLGQSNYSAAALSFIRVDPSYTTIGVVAGLDFSRCVMTGNDIAVYGGLCALASMDRSDLQTLVLENADFRNFLELEPHIRRAISLFCGAKYSQCLTVLEAYRNDYLLDVYLGSHVDALYSMIRSKSIVQYFVPFSTVSLSALAAAFPGPSGVQATTAAALLEDELVDMIQRGTLDARIDTVNQLLEAPPKDTRDDAHRDVMNTADEVEHTLRLKLHRINMMQAGLEIMPPKGSKGKGAMYGAIGSGGGGGHLGGSAMMT